MQSPHRCRWQWHLFSDRGHRASLDWSHTLPQTYKIGKRVTTRANPQPSSCKFQCKRKRTTYVFRSILPACTPAEYTSGNLVSNPGRPIGTVVKDSSERSSPPVRFRPPVMQLVSTKANLDRCGHVVLTFCWHQFVSRILGVPLHSQRIIRGRAYYPRADPLPYGRAHNRQQTHLALSNRFQLEYICIYIIQE